MQYKFTPPPYRYIHVVDLSKGDWTKPANVVICEVRCKTSGTVYMTTREENGLSRTSKRFYDDYDIDRVDVETIHQNVTSSNLRKNQITVAGHYISDLSGI